MNNNYIIEQKTLIKYVGEESIIKIPVGVEIIGDSVFENNSNIEGVIIAEGAKKIKEFAFAYSNIDYIVLPSTIEEIEMDAFDGCYISKVFFDGTLEDWCNISFKSRCANPLGSENVDTSFFIKETNGEVSFIGKNYKKIQELVFPKSIKSIGAYQFENFYEVKKIILNESIVEICCESFAGTGISNITIPSSVKSIQSGAFIATNLNEITIPNSVKEIDSDMLFFACTHLKEVLLPETIKKLGQLMFAHCKSLEFVDIPNSVTTIMHDAFLDCDNLKSIHLTSNIEKIHVDAFKGCESLIIKYDGTINQFNQIKFYDFSFSKEHKKITLNVDCTDGEFVFNIEK